MRHVILGAVVAIGLVLVVILGISVYHDAHITPVGNCSDQNGSVCVPTMTCPAGYSPSISYSCSPTTYTCCLPK